MTSTEARRDGRVIVGGERVTEASRRHARVYRDDVHWLVEDLGSTNGSYVNDNPVTKAPLRDGDFLKIGAAIFKFLTGGNIDARLLAGVLTRQLAREGRLSQLRFDIVDRPGQLATVVGVLSKTGANIVEVSHQRIFTDLPAKAVLLEVVIETRDRSHLASTIAALRAANIDVEVGEH